MCLASSSFPGRELQSEDDGALLPSPREWSFIQHTSYKGPATCQEPWRLWDTTVHKAVSALMQRMSKLTKSDGTDISLCAGAGKKIKPGGGGEAQSTVGGGRVLWSRGSERKDFLRGRSLSRDHVTFRAVNASRLSAIVILSATGTGRGVGTARWRRTCTSLHSTTSGTGRGYLLSG